MSPAPISQITNIARIDYNLSSKQVLFVRGNLQSDNASTTIPASRRRSGHEDLRQQPWPYGRSHLDRRPQTWTNNFRYGWTRQDNASQGAGSSYNSFAAVSLPFSTSTSSILYQNESDFVDDFTIVKGKHTIQFGANDRFIINTRYLTKTLYDVGTATANEVAAGGVLNQNTSLDINNTALNLSAGSPAPALALSSFKSSYNSAITAVTGLISQVSGYANYSRGQRRSDSSARRPGCEA